MQKQLNYEWTWKEVNKFSNRGGVFGTYRLCLIGTGYPIMVIIFIFIFYVQNMITINLLFHSRIRYIVLLVKVLFLGLI